MTLDEFEKTLEIIKTEPETGRKANWVASLCFQLGRELSNALWAPGYEEFPFQLASQFREEGNRRNEILNCQEDQIIS